MSGPRLGARPAFRLISRRAALGSTIACARFAPTAPRSWSGLTQAISRPASLTIDPNSGYLDQLCVAPAERGSGLATALLNEAKRRSPGVVELDVNEANARARRFYEREGFSIAGRGVSPHSGLPTFKMRWRADVRKRPPRPRRLSSLSFPAIAMDRRTALRSRRDAGRPGDSE